jgi:chaperone modulatory protein CbpM
MEAHEFSLHARISVRTLDFWCEAGWLTPHRSDEGAHYSEIDLARAHLINDLKHLGINDDGVPVILDLVDQIYGLRRVVRELLSAMKAGQGELGRE